MSLTDSATIINMGQRLSMDLQMDSDLGSNLISPTEIWLYKTASDSDAHIHKSALTKEEIACWETRIHGKWYAGFTADPKLIDSAGVWSEIDSAGGAL